MASAAPAPGSVPGTFRSLTPTRLLDTRSALGGIAPGPNGVVHLAVSGHGGVPATGVAAVALNVTVTQPAAPGWVSVYADGDAAPTTSNLNFAAAQTVANLVVAKVGADGLVDLHNGSAGTTQLLADVSGYYLAGTATEPGTYTPVSPARVLDTRVNQGGGRLAEHGVERVKVAGVSGVPSDAATVVLNVTATREAAAGYLTVYGDGHPRPPASNLNFARGSTTPNLVFALVGAAGQIDIYNGAPGATDVLVDVMGYIAAGASAASGTLASLEPTRLLDTRRSFGGVAVASHGTLRLRVGGRGGVPVSQLRAVVLNVAVVGA